MTASKGVYRSPGVPTLEWLKAQTTPEPSDLVGGDCWIWQRTTTDGYGTVCIGGKSCVAHRVAFEIVHGPVPCWLTLDHLCHRRACINPEHLEPVTQMENIRRGDSPAAVARRSGHCAHGHELPATGRCQVCLAQRKREWYVRKRSGPPAP